MKKMKKMTLKSIFEATVCRFKNWDHLGTIRGHHLGHVWGIIRACVGHHLCHVWGMCGASSGAVHDIRGATCISNAILSQLKQVSVQCSVFSYIKKMSSSDVIHSAVHLCLFLYVHEQSLHSFIDHWPFSTYQKAEETNSYKSQSTTYKYSHLTVVVILNQWCQNMI